jgi:Cu+-exporting ATPase
MSDVDLEPADTRHVALEVRGMTCASCVARIERRLGKLDGVTASVNLALQTAAVEAPPSVTDAELIRAVEGAGYHASIPRPNAGTRARPSGAHDHAAMAESAGPALGTRLAVSIPLAVPVVLFSMVSALQFRGWQWVSLVLATPVVFWCGAPFHRVTLRNLRHGATSMDSLVSIGTLAAYSWSLWALLFGGAGELGMRMHIEWRVTRGGGADIYFEVASIVIVFLLAGRYLEARAQRSAAAALRALLELGATDAAVLRPGANGADEEVRVSIDDLVVGDRFVVRPGEKIATDGVVELGMSAVDASLVTGESVPVDVAPGDAVIGATINVSGRIVVRATRVGADTQLAQIARLVSDAQNGKAEVQRLVDRVSAIFVPIVMALAVVTLIAWLALGDGTRAAFTAAVAVLIIACPCALGLATPTALLVGTGRGAQLGILIRGPEVLESTRRVDTVVLDKTGTVTTGAMAVTAVVVAEGVDVTRARQLLGALEGASEHPIARAIATEARAVVGALPAVTEFENQPGRGVVGVVNGTRVVAGQPAWLAAEGFASDANLDAVIIDARAEGSTVIVAAWDGAQRVAVVVADTLRPTARLAVDELRGLGLTPVLLTGDHHAVAQRVARDVGIDTVIADVLPAGKVAAIRELQHQGHVVAMVGDGVNDAAALAQSDLGIAMGGGADAAIEAGDLTLVRADLRDVPDAIRLARQTLRTIKGNLFWAFAYNVAAIPLAAFGFLNPMIAGAAMAGSSVFVVTNSLRLRSFRGHGPAPAAIAASEPGPRMAP